MALNYSDKLTAKSDPTLGNITYCQSILGIIKNTPPPETPDTNMALVYDSSTLLNTNTQNTVNDFRVGIQSIMTTQGLLSWIEAYKDFIGSQQHSSECQGIQGFEGIQGIQGQSCTGLQGLTGHSAQYHMELQSWCDINSGKESIYRSICDMADQLGITIDSESGPFTLKSLQFNLPVTVQCIQAPNRFYSIPAQS